MKKAMNLSMASAEPERVEVSSASAQECATLDLSNVLAARVQETDTDTDAVRRFEDESDKVSMNVSSASAEPDRVRVSSESAQECTPLNPSTFLAA